MGLDYFFMNGRLKKRKGTNAKLKSQFNQSCIQTLLISDSPPPVHPSLSPRLTVPISGSAIHSRLLPVHPSKTAALLMTTAQTSLPPLSSFDSFAHTIADDLSAKGYPEFTQTRLRSSVQSSQESMQDCSLEYSMDGSQFRMNRESQSTEATTPPSTSSSSLGSIRRNTKQLAINIAAPCKSPFSSPSTPRHTEDSNYNPISRLFLRKTPKKSYFPSSDPPKSLFMDSVSLPNSPCKECPRSLLHSPCSEQDLRGSFNRPATASQKSCSMKQSNLSLRYIDFHETPASTGTNEISAFDSDSDDETSSMKLRRSLRRGKTTNIFIDVLSRFRSGHPSPSMRDEILSNPSEEKGVWRAVNDQGQNVYVIFKCDDRKLILAGTLQYLVNQMIITLDDTFVEQLILTHQLFSTTEDILDLLFLELRTKGSQSTTRRRILTILNLWLDILPSSLLPSLKLIRSFIRESCDSGFIDESRHVARVLAAYSTLLVREQVLSRRISENTSAITFMELDIGELARYFTRVDTSIYYTVVDQSVICEYWASGKGRMAEALRRTKAIGHWVEREVKSDNSASVMCRFIQLAQILLSRADFQTAGTIIDALSRTSLQDIAHNIPLHAYESLEHLKGVFTFEPLYHSALSFAVGSVIHYLPFLLRELESFRNSEYHLNLQNCNVKYTSFSVSKDPELIHFDKYRQLLEEIRRYMIDGPLFDISVDSAVVSNWPKLFPKASVGIADVIGDHIERLISKM